MPQPPILPTIDWKALHKQGLTYKQWLKAAEHPENAKKMNELRAAIELPDHVTASLGALPRTVNVVAIAEDWCGDVVRHAPLLAALDDAAPKLRLRFIKRTDSPEAFARFLTNGGEAIPKFVFLSDKFVECGNWGPMPAVCRALVARGKASGNVGPWRRKVSAYYENDLDRPESLRELLELIDIAVSPRLD